MERSISSLLDQDNSEGLFYYDKAPEIFPQPETPPAETQEQRPNFSRFHISASPEVQCYNCKEFGHIRPACPNPNYKSRCLYCGLRDHTAFHCPQVICHKCWGVGHKIADCRNPGSDKCGICRRPGHSTRHCMLRDDYLSSSQTKHIRCINCLARGHCNCFYSDISSSSLYCCSCGDKGHTAQECRRKRYRR